MKKLGKPESNSDVINKEPKVLLIGYGWLGQYYHRYFTKADIVTSDGIIMNGDMEAVFDTNGMSPKGHVHYDLAIIGVPTKMNPKTGQCDVSIVENAVDKYKEIVDYFLIKSTVEIGTTDRLAEQYGVNIAMSPEFLGETLGHPLLEPRRDMFQIFGGEEETINTIAGFFHVVLHANAPIFLCKAKEAEIIKYNENKWIKERNEFWNDVLVQTETFGVSYDRVREGLVLDPRMDRTHSWAYPNNRGFSGSCLPKDMNALAYTMRKIGRPLTLLEQSLENNAIVRKDYKDSTKLLPDEPIWRK